MNRKIKLIAAQITVGLIVVCLLLTSCATRQTPLHPGAFNRFDSDAFDVLLVSQAVIEQAREEYINGDLTEELKPALNRLVDAYNIARDGWLTYRFVLKSGNLISEASMRRSINALTESLNAFQSERPITDIQP